MTAEPRELVISLPAGDSDRHVRHLAERVAAYVDPIAVRFVGQSQPPYQRDDDRPHFQLDQGNNWWLNAEHEPADGGRRIVRVIPRHPVTATLEALAAMLRADGYTVEVRS